VAAFLTSLAESNKKVATIQRHCATISIKHIVQGFPSPADNQQLKADSQSV
jgi:hypothetical protein